MGSDALAPDIIVGWPTAEFGGMGLEGAVNIVYRDELEDAADDSERKEIRAMRVADWKERNTGLESPVRSCSTTSSTRLTPAA